MPPRGTQAPQRNVDVLLGTLTLSGKRVLDVGCGDGALARLMAGHGAQVTGIECSPRQLAKAHAAPPAEGATVVEGVAQALPAADGSVDVVVFFNSLHHVPAEFMDKALAEAARALVPGGVLFVSEPLAEGDFFQLVRSVDDETDVRAKAYAALQAVERHGLRMEEEFVNLHPMRFDGLDGVRERIVSANAERERLFAEKEGELTVAFLHLGVADGTGRLFLQPTRINILRKLESVK